MMEIQFPVRDILVLIVEPSIGDIVAWETMPSMIDTFIFEVVLYTKYL